MRKKKRSNAISMLRDEGSRRNHDVVAGRIYWLPEKADHDIKLLETTSIEDGCFGHPVVVLGVDKKRKIAVVYIVTSLGGKCITWYADRRKYLAIYPAENPHNSNKLFLEDKLVLEKISYVTTINQHTLSWKMLKPYWDRQSGKQYRLMADSHAELLKYADLSLLATVSKRVDIVPVPSTAALYSLPLNRPLAPLSGNAVRSYETDIERHAGFNLPSRQEARPSTRYNFTLPQPATYSEWVRNSVSPSASYWQNTRHVQQPLRGDSLPIRSPFNEHSALLPNSNQTPDKRRHSKPVTIDSSWLTIPLYILAIFGVVAFGYFSLVRK